MCTLPFTPIPDTRKRWQTPEASAAYHGEVDNLQQCFAEGSSPNASHPNVISPLEAAIRGGHPECVEIILAHPAFDPTPTVSDLAAFALNGTDNAVSACCELAAPVVLGCEFKATDNAPVPEGITLPHILDAGNFILLLRYAEHHGINEKDRRRIASEVTWCTLEKHSVYGIQILGRLLAACPELLKHRAVQQCFCALALSNPNGIPQELQPFTELLPKKVILSEGSHFRWGGTGNLLSRWRSHLGTHASPYLDLKRYLPDSTPTEEEVDHLLRVCTICGKITENQVSSLLIDIITHASEDTLRTHLQHGGKLASIGYEHVARASRALMIPEERRSFMTVLLKEVASC